LDVAERSDYPGFDVRVVEGMGDPDAVAPVDDVVAVGACLEADGR
jgi:hypothetical protein